MESKKSIGSAITAGLLKNPIGGRIASEIFLKKTLYRPGKTSQEIIEEFADPEKMAQYMQKMAPVGEWFKQRTLENLYIPSRDGLRLHGLYLAADEQSDRVAILHHGFTSKAMDNMTQGKILHDLGFEVLLLDLRAHGESEGEYVGFGILDRFDTLAWIRYAKKRFGQDVKIVLQGVSMGATTALMTLGLDEAQESVSAVVADCGFTSPAEVFSSVIQKDYHLPPDLILGASNPRCKEMAGYQFDDYSTVQALENNKVPVLFIHGKEDTFVPVWMSEQNYEVCTGPKKLLLVENAGHGSSAFEDPELYRLEMTSFLAEYL